MGQTLKDNKIKLYFHVRIKKIPSLIIFNSDLETVWYKSGKRISEFKI